MIKVFIYSCLLLVFLINCKSNIPEARNKTDYSQITHYSSRSAHPISSVNFDTIRIDAGNENEMTSLLGSFRRKYRGSMRLPHSHKEVMQL